MSELVRPRRSVPCHRVATLVELDLDDLFLVLADLEGPVHWWAILTKGPEVAKTMNWLELAAKRLCEVPFKMIPGAFTLLRTDWICILVAEHFDYISGPQCKDIIVQMLEADEWRPSIELVQAAINSSLNSNQISQVVTQIIESDSQIWDRFVGGDEKVMGILIGKVMKALGGKGDGARVRKEILSHRDGTVSMQNNNNSIGIDATFESICKLYYGLGIEDQLTYKSKYNLGVESGPPNRPPWVEIPQIPWNPVWGTLVNTYLIPATNELDIEAIQRSRPPLDMH